MKFAKTMITENLVNLAEAPLDDEIAPHSMEQMAAALSVTTGLSGLYVVFVRLNLAPQGLAPIDGTESLNEMVAGLMAEVSQNGSGFIAVNQDMLNPALEIIDTALADKGCVNIEVSIFRAGQKIRGYLGKIKKQRDDAFEQWKMQK